MSAVFPHALTVFGVTWEDEMDLQLTSLNDMII